jgi:transcriptional regulator with XRE-family HTH domain
MWHGRQHRAGHGFVTRSVFTAEYGRFLGLLVDARKKAGLTQAQLAEALARPQSYVSKFERGERRVDVIELLDITDALGVDPCNLIRRIRRARKAKTSRA